MADGQVAGGLPYGLLYTGRQFHKSISGSVAAHHGPPGGTASFGARRAPCPIPAGAPCSTKRGARRTPHVSAAKNVLRMCTPQGRGSPATRSSGTGRCWLGCQQRQGPLRAFSLHTACQRCAAALPLCSGRRTRCAAVSLAHRRMLHTQGGQDRGGRPAKGARRDQLSSPPAY